MTVICFLQFLLAHASIMWDPEPFFAFILFIRSLFSSGRMDGWMDGWMDSWMDGWMLIQPCWWTDVLSLILWIRVEGGFTAYLARLQAEPDHILLCEL